MQSIACKTGVYFAIMVDYHIFHREHLVYLLTKHSHDIYLLYFIMHLIKSTRIWRTASVF